EHLHLHVPTVVRAVGDAGRLAATVCALGETRAIELPRALDDPRLRVGAIVHLARDGILLSDEQLLPGEAAAVDEPGEAPRGIGAAAEAHDEDVGADVEDLAVRLRLRARRSRQGQELVDEPAVALEN